MKIDWMRNRAEARAAENPGAPVRVITGAVSSLTPLTHLWPTATPIANSVAEAWVMQHYLRPDLLIDAGITNFDSWAATFGTLTTELEMRPEGGYRPKTRFARFDNLPELLRMWHVAADVRTTDQLNLKLPVLAMREDGQRGAETKVVPGSPELGRFMEHLVARAEALRLKSGRPQAGEDNMLVITGDGRKAALDLRMLDRSYTEPLHTGPAKIDDVVHEVATVWEATRDNVYNDHVTGEPHPRRGALQVVFADLGTPSSRPDRPWSFYGDLKERLVDRGLDPDQIRFVQDANTDAKKDRLFSDAREGKVAVLVGSTETMGVGTNVQTRLAALHHVDCPWRPADVEQREGRGIPGPHDPH